MPVCCFTSPPQAWRFMMQLRWARRRIDSARHAACKSSTGIIHLGMRDRQEEEAVAAAVAAAAAQASQRYRSLPADSPWQGSSACSLGAGGALSQSQWQHLQDWLGWRQELLLMQEMGQLLAAWQAYVMARLLTREWAVLEEVGGWGRVTGIGDAGCVALNL